MGVIQPLVRFHALGAARVAQRNGLLVIGAVILLLIGKPVSARDALAEFVLSLATTAAPTGAALFVAVIAAVIAANAAPTITAGLGGWARSLSFTGTDHRRAVTLALVIPMLPLVALESIAIALVPTVYDRELAVVRLIGLPFALVAAAVWATPSRIVARTLGVIALWLASLGRWDANLAAAIALVVADATAGALVLAPRRAERIASSSTRIMARIAIRALGWSSLGAFIPAMILPGFAYLYRVNNELSRAEAAGALRGCALMGATFLLAALADRLIVRRPPWPWARSLPVGSRRRILDDALVLGTASLIPLVITVLEDWRSGLFVLGAMPLLIVQTTGAIRRGTGRMTRAAGETILAGIVMTFTLTVWPSTVMLCLVLLPFAFAAAERADQWLAGTAWSELHHSAAGDSLAVAQ